MMKETYLLNDAKRQLAMATGVELEVTDIDYAIGQGRIVDAVAQIAGIKNPEPYAVEIKPHLTPAKVGLIAEQLKAAPFKGLLVTDYVNPRVAERLKEMDIAFIDLAGNAYINQPPIYIFIRGNKPTQRADLGRELKPTRAFQATGLKALFGFLINPDLLNETYRYIATVTDIALGTVGWVLNDLREHGYLLEKNNKKRRLIRKKELLDKWIAAYPEKLRPKLRLGCYQAPNHKWWNDVEIEKHNAQWGGEVAAAKLTGYLKPFTTTIYTDRIPPLLLLENNLKKATDGDVEIIRRFWAPELIADTEKEFHNTERPFKRNELVPNLLIYADLLATADGRNIETAKIIYDKYLYQYFRED